MKTSIDILIERIKSGEKIICKKCQKGTVVYEHKKGNRFPDIYFNNPDCNAKVIFKATPHKARRRLCTESADIFSIILHRNSLTYDSMPAEFLYNLTKNLSAHLQHKLCAVLP